MKMTYPLIEGEGGAAEGNDDKGRQNDGKRYIFVFAADP